MVTFPLILELKEKLLLISRVDLKKQFLREELQKKCGGLVNKRELSSLFFYELYVIRITKIYRIFFEKLLTIPVLYVIIMTQ